ncbi:MAG: hypothetical protein MN733_24495 [Nitrososphaera sp.]|nr:hypothetical protein [Nitrososphaera sp.]
MNDPRDSRLGESREATWMAVAVGCSALGMAFHTVREFGYSGLWSLGTGMIPVVGVQIFLFAVWWLSPRARTGAGIALVLTGVLQLIGGVNGLLRKTDKRICLCHRALSVYPLGIR